MSKLFAIASIAAMSAAEENIGQQPMLHELISQYVENSGAAYSTDQALMVALIDEVLSLREDLDSHEGRLDSGDEKLREHSYSIQNLNGTLHLHHQAIDDYETRFEEVNGMLSNQELQLEDHEERLGDAESDITELQQEDQIVIEEQFYSNDEFIWEFRLGQGGYEPNYRCFDEFIVHPDQSLNFRAVMSTDGTEFNAPYRGSLYVIKNNEEIVAYNREQQGAKTYFSLNPSIAYSHKNQSSEDEMFRLCTYIAFPNFNSLDLKFKKNMFQWGYKIMGSDYNLQEHRFASEDLKIGSDIGSTIID